MRNEYPVAMQRIYNYYAINMQPIWRKYASNMHPYAANLPLLCINWRPTRIKYQTNMPPVRNHDAAVVRAIITGTAGSPEMHDRKWHHMNLKITIQTAKPRARQRPAARAQRFNSDVNGHGWWCIARSMARNALNWRRTQAQRTS